MASVSELLFSSPSTQSSTTQRTAVTTPNLSAQQSALYPQLLGGIADLAFADPSTRVAGYNQYDTAASEALGDLTPWRQGIAGNVAGLNSLFSSISNSPEVTPNALAGIPFNKYFRDFYMSPYMEDVVGRVQNDAIQQGERQRTIRNASLGASSYGGSRQAVADAMADEALNKQVGDQTAKLRQDAYTQAQAQFERDRQAREFDISKGLEAEGLTRQNYSTAADIARAALEGNKAGFGMTADQINLLGKRADTNRQIDQNVLNYPLNTLQILANTLRSVPSGTTTTTTGSDSTNKDNSVNPISGGLSLLASLFGAGKTGVDIYNQLFGDSYSGEVTPFSEQVINPTGLNTSMSNNVDFSNIMNFSDSSNFGYDPYLAYEY